MYDVYSKNMVQALVRMFVFGARLMQVLLRITNHHTLCTPICAFISVGYKCSAPQD